MIFIIDHSYYVQALNHLSTVKIYNTCLWVV